MATASTKRNAVVNQYKKIIGRNIYSQSLRDYCYRPYRDGKYYSDCSSSVSYAYKEAGESFGIMNTASMYVSDKFKTINAKIVNGHITNTSKLRVGDMLLFAGWDNERKWAGYAGHVEMVYSISGGVVKLCGHGSGVPRVIKLKEFETYRLNCKTSTPIGDARLIKVIRYIQDDAKSTKPTVAKTKYFKKCSYTGVSIVTALNSIGANSTYAYRAKVAVANGISKYSGTASQNLKMVALLKAGKLIQP